MPVIEDRSGNQVFPVFLIQPSHYDDDGYVIQWVRSEIPSNSMAMLYGLALDCAARHVLGENVEIELKAIDETNMRIRPQRIIRRIKACGGQGLVALVGVQSNQFPRALDIARPLRDAGIEVCLGGFHVSGCIAMLDDLPDDIKQAQAMGISLFAGEAEGGRLDQVLRDAYAGRLRPLYNYMNDLPGLEGAVVPTLPMENLHRIVDSYSSFDCGRGCPFQCSFCTIINVQGRKSRYRSADDVEAILRQNHDRGITSFFITDDNFARNRNWEAIFDRIIELRDREAIDLKLILQVDTLCHKIPNFIEKAARAGVRRVFIGLENINPDNLTAAMKKQNRITEYRAMLLAWRAHRVITNCGYIIGFPGDTPERVARDIEIMKRELPIDIVEFFVLTPLPGSQDHKDLLDKGAWMEPDMNKYDLEHVCAKHPKMSRAELAETYDKAWDAFYTRDHVEKIIRRSTVTGLGLRKFVHHATWFYGCHKYEGVHPLQGGLVRRKYRRDRRPTLPVENPLVFYPKLIFGFVVKSARQIRLYWGYARIRKRILKDPAKRQYSDRALTPVSEAELDHYQIYSASRSAKAAVDKARAHGARQAAIASAGRIAASPAKRALDIALKPGE
jgi:tRNA A37 methylthiotransferase MiaB